MRGQSWGQSPPKRGGGGEGKGLGRGVPARGVSGASPQPKTGLGSGGRGMERSLPSRRRLQLHFPPAFPRNWRAAVRTRASRRRPRPPAVTAGPGSWRVPGSPSLPAEPFGHRPLVLLPAFPLPDVWAKKFFRLWQKKKKKDSNPKPQTVTPESLLPPRDPAGRMRPGLIPQPLGPSVSRP